MAMVLTFRPRGVVANDLRPYFGLPATLVRDFVPDQGPLMGIYTALMCSPNPWILARAVDMPFFTPPLLVAMMQECKETVEVVVPLVADQYEPLFALYHRRCLGAIRAVLEEARRQVKEEVRTALLDFQAATTSLALADPPGQGFQQVRMVKGLHAET